MMTKKDYQRAAEKIKQYGDANTRQLLIDFMIGFFKGDNPRFDENRFESAAQYVPLKNRKVEKPKNKRVDPAEQEGARMIIDLQKVAGITETMATALKGWRAMSDDQKAQTRAAHAVVCATVIRSKAIRGMA